MSGDTTLDRDFTALEIKSSPGFPRFQFSPSIITSGALNHLIKKNENPGIIIDIIDLTGLFILELSNVLKGRIIYPSVYSAGGNSAVTVNVKDYKTIELVYYNLFGILLEITSQTDFMLTGLIICRIIFIRSWKKSEQNT